MHQNPSDAKGNGRTLWRLAKRFQLLIAALVLAACGSALALESSEEQTVLQALQAQSEEFTTFLTMVEQAGLTESLSGEGPITVLAPTNAAFADMDANALTALQSDADQAASFLNGLIISGSYLMTDLEQAQDGSLAPLSGEAYEVEMTAGGLTVNGVGFAATDVDNVYANGVVHVTNGVVLPQALRAAADAEPAAEGATEPVGQADPTAPAAPAAPGTAPEPAESQPTTAFVRVVQLSPNSTVDVVLTPQEEGLTAIDLSGLEYMAGSGYQEIQPGTYLVSATLPDSQDALFDAPNETFDAGNYYTVAISGLQVPADADDTEEAEGFGGWLRDLFGGDGDRDALAIRATTYRDEVREGATDTRVRIINAAPGSPAFDVVVVNAEGERNVIANDMTYGDETGTQNIDDLITGLEVTAADSAAMALDLTQHLPLAADTTIFLVGTTFEGVPFDVLVLQNGTAGSGTDTGTEAQ